MGSKQGWKNAGQPALAQYMLLEDKDFVFESSMLVLTL